MGIVKTIKPAAQEDGSQFFLQTKEIIDDFIICKRPDKLKRLVESVVPGSQVHFISDGEWSMHDIVVSLIQKFRPADLYISTYAIRDFPIKQLILAQERREVNTISMVVDSRAHLRSPEGFALARQNANRIVQTAIHAKVTVIKSPSGCVSISSSQNWTQNPKIEAGVISCSDALANFHIDWMTKILNNVEIFK